MAVKALLNKHLQQTCGVGELGWFQNNLHADAPFVSDVTPKGGCGWVIAGFTKQRKECEEAYDTMKKRWKLVYQSPVRKNSRTGNDFFFCLFDSREKP